MQRRIALLIVLFFFLTFTKPVGAQDASTALSLMPDECDNENLDIEKQLLNNINQFRLNSSVVPVVFNYDLCVAAHNHLNELLSRGQNPGNLDISNDGKILKDWVQQQGYLSYPDRYVVDAIISYSLDLNPLQVGTDKTAPNVIAYWWGQRGDEYNKMINSNFREIGIAYSTLFASDGSTRYVYVIIFGAQPNILPIIVADPSNPWIPAEFVNSPQITLLIQNENYLTNGNDATVGKAFFIHISQNSELLECPIDPLNLSPEWMRFNPRVTYELEDRNIGQQTIYVEFCDARRNRIVSSTSVNYQGPTLDIPAAPTLPPEPTVDNDSAIQTSVASTLAALATATSTPSATFDTQFAINLTITAILGTASAVPTATPPTTTSTFTETPTSQPITPLVPTDTPAPPTSTDTPFVPTATDTPVPPTFTDTPAPTTTDTPSPTFTVTPAPTDTPVPPTSTNTSLLPLLPLTGTPKRDKTSLPTPTIVRPDFRLNVRWNDQYLVIRNSGETALPADALRNITFVGRNETGFSGTDVWNDSSFTHLNTNSCLMIFNGTLVIESFDDALEIVRSIDSDCKTLRLYTGITTGDMVWSLADSDSFQVVYAGSTVALCQRFGGTCLLDQVAFAPLPLPTPNTILETGAANIVWQGGLLVIVNVSDKRLDFSTLALSDSVDSVNTISLSASATNPASLNRVSTYDCVVVYAGSGETPPLPDTVKCSTQVSKIQLSSAFGLWVTNQKFVVKFDGVEVQNCPSEGHTTSCIVNAPVAR